MGAAGCDLPGSGGTAGRAVGAGKTTITHLVPRLYDPARGAVRIGGHDVRDLTLESLRSVVGVVPQDAHLFHDTIRANLLYARPSATENELIEGAGRPGHDRGGPGPPVLRRGETAPRVGPAAAQGPVRGRARQGDRAPGIPIRGADPAGTGDRAGRADSLVIAHRLSTVRAADQILAVSGVYAGLYRTQFAAQAALRSFLEEGNAYPHICQPRPKSRYMPDDRFALLGKPE